MKSTDLKLAMNLVSARKDLLSRLLVLEDSTATVSVDIEGRTVFAQDRDDSRDACQAVRDAAKIIVTGRLRTVELDLARLGVEFEEGVA